MRTICLASAKGGSGKSTLSTCLAVEAEKRGERVALIDLDPQGSIPDWLDLRGDRGELGFADNPVSIPRAISKLADEGCTLVVIDTPPEIIRTIHAGMRAADLVLIPVKPSLLDIAAAEMVVELAIKDGKPYAFVINEAPSRGTRTEQTIDVLSAAGDVLETVVTCRSPFVTAISKGKTGAEIDSAAGAEITSLWKEVAALLPARKGRT